MLFAACQIAVHCADPVTIGTHTNKRAAASKTPRLLIRPNTGFGAQLVPWYVNNSRILPPIHIAIAATKRIVLRAITTACRF